MDTKASQVCLVLLAVALCLTAGACAPSGAERFKGNPLFDPSFVPIAVGSQNLNNAGIYHDAGINLYVGIDDIVENPTKPTERKPTADALRVLGDLGMYAIANQETWGKLKDSPIIVGWICPVDEPDNKGEGGKPMPLDKYLAESAKFKAGDPTRPYVVCFGQGVTNDGFRGRGLPRSEYRKYMEPADFIQYDFYPIANFKWRFSDSQADANAAEPMRKDGERHLDMVGQGISRIRRWTNNQKPVMAWIETSHNHNRDGNRIATPQQTNCEVWVAMVYGARGVAYFSHDFFLPIEVGQAAALSRNKPMLAQLKLTNAKLTKLARAISAPLAGEPERAFSETGQVVFSTKMVDGATVILAVNTVAEPAKATVAVEGLRKLQTLDVLEESRTVKAAAEDCFADDFGPYQEHVYKIRD
jgi:hypothetical protein